MSYGKSMLASALLGLSITGGASAAVISIGAGVSAIGYWNNFGNASYLNDGNTSTNAAYHTTASDELLAYDLGGIATVNSVKVYQTDLGSRLYVSTWRVFYEGGYQDITGDPSGISTLTLSSPVQTQFVSVQALTSSGGDANKAIAEIEVNGTAPVTSRPDLAAGQSWTRLGWGDTFGTAAFTTEAMFASPNNNGGWNPILGVGNNYIQIDLGSEQQIGGMGVLQIAGNRQTLKDAQMQFSNDPIFGTYTSVSLTGLLDTMYFQENFGTQSARYVRLVATDVYSGDTNWGVKRLQLFSPSESTPIPEPTSVGLLVVSGLALLRRQW